MTTNVATPTIGAVLDRAAGDMFLTAIGDLLAANGEPELEADPEGVFAAWLAEVPGAQAVSGDLLEALRVQACEVTHPDAATMNAALNAFWALRVAMVAAVR